MALNTDTGLGSLLSKGFDFLHYPWSLRIPRVNITESNAHRPMAVQQKIKRQSMLLPPIPDSQWLFTTIINVHKLHKQTDVYGFFKQQNDGILTSILFIRHMSPNCQVAEGCKIQNEFYFPSLFPPHPYKILHGTLIWKLREITAAEHLCTSLWYPGLTSLNSEIECMSSLSYP